MGLDKFDPRLNWCFGGLALSYQMIKEGESGSAAHLSGVEEGAIHA
jgi:hypothetical protein